MNEQGMSQNGWIESPEHNADGNSLTALDAKITDMFPGVTVRKDLVNKVKGNALVPSYVLEFLLSAYATNTDQASIESGVDRVRAILANNYVHREEANLIQSKIREKGSHRIIDRVQVVLNDKTDLYEATFSNLGISQVIVDPSLVKAYPKLLVTGIWCMCQIGYAYSGDPREVPWQLLQLKPVQMSRDDRENYMQQRSQFTDSEWIDLLMQSIGFNPDLFSDRAKLLHLVRMVPFVERNYNLVELGPKGTGKSHIYSEFSPHGMLISGGEVTVAKLFVNNSNGHLGLVGGQDNLHTFIIYIVINGSCRIASSSYTSHQVIGIFPSFLFFQLLFDFFADNGLQTCHHIRVGMRAYGRADDIVSIGRVATPVADGFVCSIFQCHVAGSDRADFGSQHFHFFYIDMLAFYIGLAHVNNALHVHQSAYRSGGHPMLSSSGFCNDTFFPHTFCQ